jgi:dinuclear metal center YbgI/SA1388 family protein
MITVGDVNKLLDEYAPVRLKEGFDNVGLLVGDEDAGVTRVLVALDITAETVKEAVSLGAQLIVSHHPVFFSLSSVTEGDCTGRLVRSMIKNGLSAICMHTNLDKVRGGVNDMLAAALGLRNIKLLINEGQDDKGRTYGLCRTCEIAEPMPVAEFIKTVSAALGCKCIRYADAGKPVKKVAVGGGSCGDYIPQVIEAGCDTFVTADLKYHMFLNAPDKNLNLIDAGHYPTENIICPQLRDVISEKFPELSVLISERHDENICYSI